MSDNVSNGVDVSELAGRARTLKRGVIAARDVLVRASISHYLAHSGAVRIETQAASAAELLRATVAQTPDFIVACLPLAGPAPDALVEQMRQASPATRIIVVLDEANAGASERLARVPGDVLVTRQVSLESLVAAVHSKATLWPTPRSRARGEILSERQSEVLGLAATGLSNQEIARALSISPQTVKRHLADVFDRLHTRSRIGAVNSAIAAGLLEPPMSPTL